MAAAVLALAFAVGEVGPGPAQVHGHRVHVGGEKGSAHTILIDPAMGEHLGAADERDYSKEVALPGLGDRECRGGCVRGQVSIVLEMVHAQDWFIRVHAGFMHGFTCHARSAPAVFLIALSSAACYTYAPVEPAGRPTGFPARIHLTAPGALRFSEKTGEPRRTVEGRALRWAADTLVLSIGRAAGRMGFARTYDTVRIPGEDIQALEAKRFSAWRTAALIGGTGAIVGALVAALFDAAGGGGGAPGESPPDRAVAPARVRFP